jgi:CRP-like cAMP-binding protein
VSAPFTSDIDPLVRKIESVAPFALSEAERAALLGLPMQVQALRADQDVIREGDRPSRCCILLEGFASTYKTTLGGKRQITAFYIAGDIPDLMSLHLRVLDASIGTLTPCRVAFIQHEPMRELCERHPRIAAVLWRTTLIDGAVFREWMLNVGQREAYARLAHLLCEVVTRMGAVGLAEGHSCKMPITQTELGDATGISTVHVNRTLQELRGDGLISLRDGTLTVHDWEGLSGAGEFDATYLHLEPREAA